jgi:TonB-linked SusC/RagA family outer membrane protein
MKKHKMPLGVRKLSGFLLFLLCFVFFSESLKAQSVTINMSNVPLVNILKEIQNQTPYTFVYTSSLIDVKKKVSISVTNEEIVPLLNKLLTGTDISYKIVDKQITLSPKEFKNEKSGTPPGQQKGRPVSGFIYDESKLALPGVSIQNLNTKKGTFSDEKGAYVIEAEDGDRLRFYSIGMVPKEITVTKGMSVCNVDLISDAIQLQDVVVTGYQSISKDRAAGAVSIINAAEIQNRPSINLISAMDGMFSGLRVYGDGGTEKLTIRGISTMTMGISNPLVVVDGFAVEDGLESVNPNDVESVHVLKDASAASIWGARSSNGVVVITTKRAKKGLHVKFNSFLAIQDKIDLDYANPIASSADALQWEKYLWENDKTWPSFSISRDVDGNNNPVTLGITLLNMRDLGRISQSEFTQKWSELEQTDYRDDVYKYLLQNAVTQNYDLSVNGAAEKYQYVFNVRYNEDQSAFKYNDNKEILANFRNIYSITPWLDFNFSIMTKFTKSNSSGASLSDIKDISPYEKLVDGNGNYTKMVGAHYQEFIDAVNGIFPKDWNYNLLQEIRSREILSDRNSLRLQTSLNFKLFKGLTYETKFQYELYKTENSSYYSEDSYYVRDQINKWVDYDQANKEVLKTYVPLGGQLLKGYYTNKAYNFGNQLKYNQVFGRHEVTGGIFTEISSSVNESFIAPTVYGYDPDMLTSQTPEIYYPIHSYWGATNYTLSGLDPSMHYTDERFFSLLGNAAYTYDTKYSLTGSFRIDASNLIVDDPKYRYAPFWSVGGNWKADKELFIQDLDIFERLNLRFSYGQTGNVVTSTSFVPLVTMMGVYSPTGAEYAVINDYGNPTLTWERTKTTNLGIDFALRMTKFYGTIELYNKHGIDIVGEIDLPRLTGTSLQEFNTAEILNRGVELSLNYELTSPATELTWLTKLNFSYNYSEVLSLKRVSYSSASIKVPHFEEGKPVGAIYSYKYLGINENNLPYIQGIGENTWTFNDVAPSTSDHRDYMVYSGSTQPNTLLGWQNSLYFKGFHLSAFITGEFGHIFRKPTFNYPILTNAKESSILHKDLVKVLNNTATDIPLMPSTTETNLQAWGALAQYLNTTIDNASSIRLQEVNLSYTLPASVISAIGFSNIKLYCQVSNVGLLWTANKEGIDPRYILNSSSSAAVTLVKPPRKYTFGLSFEF